MTGQDAVFSLRAAYADVRSSLKYTWMIGMYSSGSMDKAANSSVKSSTPFSLRVKLMSSGLNSPSSSAWNSKSLSN